MRILVMAALLVALLAAAPTALAQGNPCAKNPCAKNPCAKNPCAKNPCAKNPCAKNPCAKNPCNPCGKSAVPAPNPQAKKHGIVFTVNDPVGRDSVTFSSSAPLEDFVGTTSKVGGWLAFDPKSPEKGVKGEFRVSVKDLDTGIPLRNEHMQGEQWLDAARHPFVTFRIDGANRVRTVKADAGFRTYQMSLIGTMTIRGVSRRTSVPARVTYLPESAKTRSRAPGDLLAGRASFTVSLANYGVKGMDGVVGSKVGETITVKVSVMGSSKAPAAGNPCNPCAKNPCAKNPCNPCAKAANPCNPCAKKR